MDFFAFIAFIFGSTALITAVNNESKIKKLQKRLDELEK